jgi:hypothetical protein
MKTLREAFLALIVCPLLGAGYVLALVALKNLIN